MPDNSEDPRQHSPHDAFVFQQFSELDKARSLLQEVLPPELAGRVHWPSLAVIQSRFVDPELRSHLSDLVYRADWMGSEEPLFFYLLFEHKSFVDTAVPLQMLVGITSLWQQYLRDRTLDGQRLRLPFIFPLVLYHGNRSWTVSQRFRDLVYFPEGLWPVLQSYSPTFEYALLDLHQTRLEEIRGSAPVRMILSLLKAVSEGQEQAWCERVFYPLLPALRQQDAAGFARELLLYLARSSGRIDGSTFKAIVDRIPAATVRSQVMTVAEELYERGWKEGSKEWQKRSLVSALEARFGSLSPELRSKVLTPESEDDYADAMRRAVTCCSAGEFFRRQ